MSTLKGKISFLIAMATLVLTGACSVGRKASYGKGVYSDPFILARNYDPSTGMEYQHYGEFQIQADLRENFAYVDVLSLGAGWNASIQYRVVARLSGSSNFVVLADNLSVAPGYTFEVNPQNGKKIWDYVEWKIEFKSSAYGSGSVIAADVIPWNTLL